MDRRECWGAGPRLWALGAGFSAYLLFGSLMFSALELPLELELRRQVERMKAAFLREHACVSPAELEGLLRRLAAAARSGIPVTGNATRDSNWDFPSSIFFVITLLTTTGYGRTVPITKAGKAFCMLYTLLGVPITLLLLGSLVQRLMGPFQRAPVALVHRRWGLPLRLAETAHALVSGLAVAVCFFLLPALLFMKLERDWDFWESLYFCFISLSTIGLGAYVPGTSRYPGLRYIYRLGVSCYLVAGLIALLVVFETFYRLWQVQVFVHLFVTHERPAPCEEGQPAPTRPKAEGSRDR